MKKHLVIRTMLLALVLICAVTLAVALLGTSAMPSPELPPPAAMSALLAHLHSGQIFRLSSVYPSPWDEVLITHGDTLTQEERDALHRFEPTFAFQQAENSLLLFLQGGKVVSTLQYPPFQRGNPYFMDFTAPEGGHYRYSRENAVFLCTFQETGENGSGYFECTPVGEENSGEGLERV